MLVLGCPRSVIMAIAGEDCVEPDVPIRAFLGHRHHTWANTFHSRPERYFQPHTLNELQKIVNLARKSRRRIVTVGCGHSPSDLTCTSQWMINLDRYDDIIDIDNKSGKIVMQAGIRLHYLKSQLREHGLAMPNYGSIDHQSIAGAISTGTHGSSAKHGLISQSVSGLKLLLANGQVVDCGPKQNTDLFRAALVSLGALGIIVEITFQAVPSFNIEWTQNLHPLSELLSQWDHHLWTAQEFTRIWWMPYMKKGIKWSANKTDKSVTTSPSNGWSATLGYYAYQSMLYAAQWFPSLLPEIEKFVGMFQYGISGDASQTGVDEDRTGLLMNCMYSQFVNEWAIPLHKGPEAISRISSWLNHDDPSSGIPFPSKGIYVHAPIEVRVADTTKVSPRPFLDNTAVDSPTLYLNFTLYRPFGADPPCRERYYEACEWLMKEMGGKPHWAKNFTTVSKDDFHTMYPDMERWLKARNTVDPDGMFVGDWHQRHILPIEGDARGLAFAEQQEEVKAAKDGGLDWRGAQNNKPPSPQASHASEESFDMVQGAEAERSVLLHHDKEE